MRSRPPPYWWKGDGIRLTLVDRVVRLDWMSLGRWGKICLLAVCCLPVTSFGRRAFNRRCPCRRRRRGRAAHALFVFPLFLLLARFRTHPPTNSPPSFPSRLSSSFFFLLFLVLFASSPPLINPTYAVNETLATRQ